MSKYLHTFLAFVVLFLAGCGASDMTTTIDYHNTPVTIKNYSNEFQLANINEPLIFTRQNEKFATVHLNKVSSFEDKAKSVRTDSNCIVIDDTDNKLFWAVDNLDNTFTYFCIEKIPDTNLYYYLESSGDEDETTRFMKNIKFVGGVHNAN